MSLKTLLRRLVHPDALRPTLTITTTTIATAPDPTCWPVQLATRVSGTMFIPGLLRWHPSPMPGASRVVRSFHSIHINLVAVFVFFKIKWSRRYSTLDPPRFHPTETPQLQPPPSSAGVPSGLPWRRDTSVEGESNCSIASASMSQRGTLLLTVSYYYNNNIDLETIKSDHVLLVTTSEAIFRHQHISKE